MVELTFKPDPFHPNIYIMDHVQHLGPDSLHLHLSIRSPIWRKGGVVFGPKPRDYSTTIPKKKKIRALISALSSKARDQHVVVLDGLKLESPKTKILSGILKKIKLAGEKTLFGLVW